MSRKSRALGRGSTCTYSAWVGSAWVGLRAFPLGSNHYYQVLVQYLNVSRQKGTDLGLTKRESVSFS